MGAARIASLFSAVVLLAAAPSEARARSVHGGAEPTKASRSGPHEIGAPSFTLQAATAIGSKWGSVTSTRRTRQHNQLVGGAPNSFHLIGRAIDIARRPGVRHAEIEASYRNAGFVLVESLDEGDHSHFAFGAARWAAVEGLGAKVRQATRASASGCPATAMTQEASLGRRRPDRSDDCGSAEEPNNERSSAAIGVRTFE